jgi:hypothetical protein
VEQQPPLTEYTSVSVLVSKAIWLSSSGNAEANNTPTNQRVHSSPFS